MNVTKNIARQLRRGLCAVALVPALMLPACGDKEAPIDPGHRAELAKERAATEREKSLRHVAEDRFGKLLVASVLAVGVALLLGVAIGSSSRRKTEGTDLEGAKTDV